MSKKQALKIIPQIEGHAYGGDLSAESRAAQSKTRLRPLPQLIEPKTHRITADSAHARTRAVEHAPCLPSGGLCRGAFRCGAVPILAAQAFSIRLIKMTQHRRWFGRRRLHDLSDHDLPGVNKNKASCKEQGLAPCLILEIPSANCLGVQLIVL